jgi:hypothetical protein
MERNLTIKTRTNEKKKTKQENDAQGHFKH